MFETLLSEYKRVRHVGSTEKMGLGSNFQERLVALHHLSPCFRPADHQQREGRILRQGNIFPEVHICTYVTENSFDAFMWGLVESKARFISQIMAGEVTARTAEDVDQMVMTAAQIKAIASGNPQILEKGRFGNRTGEARTALQRVERKPAAIVPADGIIARTT